MLSNKHISVSGSQTGSLYSSESSPEYCDSSSTEEGELMFCVSPGVLVCSINYAVVQ